MHLHKAINDFLKIHTGRRTDLTGKKIAMIALVDGPTDQSLRQGYAEAHAVAQKIQQAHPGFPLVPPASVVPLEGFRELGTWCVRAESTKRPGLRRDCPEKEFLRAQQIGINLQSQDSEALRGVPMGREYMLRLADVLETYADEQIDDDLEFMCQYDPHPFGHRMFFLLQHAEGLFQWMRVNNLSGVADELARRLVHIKVIADGLDKTSPSPANKGKTPDDNPARRYARHTLFNGDLKGIAERLREVADSIKPSTDKGEPSMTSKEIVNAIQRDIAFFQKKWAEFLAWMEELTQEVRKHEAEQTGDLYETKDRQARTIAENRWKAQQKTLETQGWTVANAHNFPCMVGGYRYFHMPSEIVSPIAHLLCFGNAPSLSREQLLLLDCAVLAVRHDSDDALEGRALRVYERGTYEGQFDCENFINEMRGTLRRREDSGELQRTWQRVQHLPKPAPAPSPAVKNEGESREIPWDDDRADFILISQAQRDYCDGINVPSLGTLGRSYCKPDGEFDYMKKGQRRKVHKAQFKAFADSQGWTKEAIQKAKMLTKVWETSPEGQRERQRKQLRKKYDMNWKEV